MVGRVWHASRVLPLNHSIELGVDARELLVIQINRRPQFPDFPIDFIDLLLKLADLRAPVLPRPVQLVVEPQHFVRKLAAPALAERFADRRFELGHRQGLRLGFSFGTPLRMTVQELFDLVPARNQEKQATDPAGDFKRISSKRRIHKPFERVRHGKAET